MTIPNPQSDEAQFLSDPKAQGSSGGNDESANFDGTEVSSENEEADNVVDAEDSDSNDNTDSSGHNIDDDNFDMENIPDLTGHYNVNDLHVDDYFLFNAQLCILSSENTDIGPMPKVVCVPIYENYEQESPPAESPCIYDNKIISHEEQWSEYRR